MKMIGLTIVLCFLACSVHAQGCSDAGVCTIGDFYAQKAAHSRKYPKHEVDYQIVYATHGDYERFYQLQLNYRYIRNAKSFFEIRVPFNYAKQEALDISNSGVGDIILTYNNQFNFSKQHPVKYSAGLRVSLTDASEGRIGQSTYPMYLQHGLGTTDILAAASYDLSKYFNVSTGFQVPVLQYNKNIPLTDSVAASTLYAELVRQPDALLKLTGVYEWRKFKFMFSPVAIFHLGNDFYASPTKYIIRNSKGLTLNLAAELGYMFSKKWKMGAIYAAPIKTRDAIPDGLARSAVVSMKLTYAFQ
ncbi:MAG TPA: hypothetical protein VKH37_00375 [Ferruginibacter sp.]|nr:hypothetical protein [Ferruginibacter sp.]